MERVLNESGGMHTKKSTTTKMLTTYLTGKA